MSEKHYENISEPSSDFQYSLSHDLISLIIELLGKDDVASVQEHLSSLHAADIAELLNITDSEIRRKIVNICRDGFNPEILVDLEAGVKDEVISLLGTEQSAAAIVQLEHDDAIQVIEDLEKEEQDEILEAIPRGQRDDLEEVLSSYAEGTAGRMMDTKFVAVPKSWTVGQTIDHLRDCDELPDDFYSIFVVDRGGCPVGGVWLSRAIRNKRSVKINSLLEEKLYTLNLDMDQEEVAYIFRKYALSSAPVLDDKGRIVGVITMDDVVDVINEEAEEDIMRMGGVHSTDLYSTFSQTAMRRFPWLLINLFTAVAASAVIAMFEGSIERLVALAVLMPIVASMAGNAGTQTLTIAVRSLATRELTVTNAARIIRKELCASVINGILFAVIVGVVCFVYYGQWNLSFVFAISTIVALVIAAFFGTIIPLALVRYGVDPAVASGVFLTTVTDISAFFIFLGLASLWLV